MKEVINMAVVKSGESAKLIIKVQTGTNTNGDPTYAQRSISNLNPAATDADVYAVGAAIGKLQEFPVDSVNRQDTAELINE